MKIQSLTRISISLGDSNPTIAVAAYKDKLYRAYPGVIINAIYVRHNKIHIVFQKP